MPTIDVSHAFDLYPGTEHSLIFPELSYFSPVGVELHYQRVADLLWRRLHR